MKSYPALPLLLSLLGIIAHPLSSFAAPTSSSTPKQNSSSSVILRERGVLSQSSPVLQVDGSYYQIYNFQGAAGQSVQITLESRDFDAYLILLDGSGQKLAENDDIGNGITDASISLNLPYSGQYQIVVNSYDAGQQGVFTLTVADRERSATPVGQLRYACPPDSYYSGNYAQVRTQDGDALRVRATPNGAIIGAIPSGWQVIVYETDSSGQWTRVGSHFGPNFDRMELHFASAQAFRAGWVATSFLRNLGFSCEKPANLRTLLQPELFGQREIILHEDWIARGDRLAKLTQNRPSCPPPMQTKEKS